LTKQYEAQANTIEEAVAQAAAALGRPADELTVEVLQEPQKKTLGLFGGAQAIVRVSYEENRSAAEVAREYLVTLLRDMGLAEPVVTLSEEEETCRMTVEGEDLGFIIGRRGDTLDALQYLVSLVANRAHGDEYLRVTIDVGDYREKRQQALVDLAHRMGKKASKSGRKQSLEPMNPYERRIVHTAVQDVEGATSWSVGSEPHRHVVIGPSDDNPNKSRSRSGSRRPRANGESAGAGQHRGERPARDRRRDEVPQRPPRQVREFIPRSNPTAAADDTPLKTESETETTATLYGRIDL
jgi:spoIIIJ-associated protein